MTILGKEYVDSVSGFSGIATGKVEYISGSSQTQLTAPVGVDGKFPDPYWFDDARLNQRNPD